MVYFSQSIPGVYHITPGHTQKSIEEKDQYFKQLERNRQYIQDYKAKNGITTQFEKEMYL